MVASISANANPQITSAIRQAAQSTGISFEYLLTTAQIESNLNPAAQASTSTAKGLYQFIEQTWLATMKGAGAASGYGQFADAISRSPDGRYDVADPTMRAAIMRLRGDPAASAMMAGSFTRNNADQLRSAIGRQPSDGELYIAHFLGPDGAGKLIGAAGSLPHVSAAAMFPQAAAANPSIFYDSAGRARSVGGVYAKLTGRFENPRAISFAGRQSVAASQGLPPVQANVAPATLANLPSGLVGRGSSRDTAGCHPGLCRGQHRAAPAAGQHAVVPIDVFGSGAQWGDAARQQPVGACHGRQ